MKKRKVPITADDLIHFEFYFRYDDGPIIKQTGRFVQPNQVVFEPRQNSSVLKVGFYHYGYFVKSSIFEHVSKDYGDNIKVSLEVNPPDPDWPQSVDELREKMQ